MKKLLLILLCLPMIGFGQKEMPPFMSQGDGIYIANWSKGTLGWGMHDKYIKEAREKMMAFGKEKNAQVEVIRFEESQGWGKVPSLAIKFRLVYNSTKEFVGGTNQKAKDKAVQDLKKLKELLDMDIITKEEYNKKAKELKKIVLE